MRILRITFIFIFVIVALFLIASSFIPSNYRVERSIIANAPIDLVYEQMSLLKNWEKWSPMKQRDPEMKSLFGNDNGKNGANWLWKGDKVGNGRLTITDINELEQITYHLKIESPMEAEADGYLKLEPDKNNTKITWVEEGAKPFHLRVLNLLMDKKIGPEFEKGLELLKLLAEHESEILQKQYFGYRIKQKKYAGNKVGYVRKAILITELNEFFAKNYSKIKTEAKNCNFKIEGEPIALYYRWDYVNGVATVAAAIPVMGDSTLGNDVGLMQLQPQKALLLNYYGGYKSNANAYKALDNYLKNKNLRQAKPVIEEYIIGPKQQRDSSKWHTRIWYLLQ